MTAHPVSSSSCFRQEPGPARRVLSVELSKQTSRPSGYSVCSSVGSAKNTSDSTAKNSAGLSAAYGSIACLSRLRPRARKCAYAPLIALCQSCARHRRQAAAGSRSPRRSCMSILCANSWMTRFIPALDQSRARLDDVGPGQDHRAAGHRLAGERLVAPVHDSGFVLVLQVGDELVRIDDDVLPAVVVARVEIERRARRPGSRS